MIDGAGAVVMVAIGADCVVAIGAVVGTPPPPPPGGGSIPDIMDNTFLHNTAVEVNV